METPKTNNKKYYTEEERKESFRRNALRNYYKNKAKKLQIDIERLSIEEQQNLFLLLKKIRNDENVEFDKKKLLEILLKNRTYEEIYDFLNSK